MARRPSASELQARADRAKAIEKFRADRRVSKNAGQAPKSKPAQQTVYYRDPIILGRVLEFDAPSLGIARLGGVADCGLLDDAPSGSTPVKLFRKTDIPIIRLAWYFGDATSVKDSTPWGSIWTRRYDKNGEQSHYSVPFTIATGTFNFNTILDKAKSYFERPDGTKITALLGAKGQATLYIGREVLWRS